MSADTLAQIRASTADGGWSMTGSVINDADALTFDKQINAWYDLYINSGWDNIRVAFNGHLNPNPWSRAFQSSVAPFIAGTAQTMLKDGKVQGVFYKNVGSSPANRHQIITMTYAKIFYEIFGGHTNLMHKSEAANYDSSLWSGAFTTPTWDEGFVTLNIDTANSSSADEYDMKEGSMWSRLQELADNDNYYLFFKKNNELNYIRHPMFGTLPTVTVDLTNDLMVEPLVIEALDPDVVGQVKVNGFTPAGGQISGKYPTQPDPGPIREIGGYYAANSANLAAIAERIYKFDSRGYTVTVQVGNAIGLMLELMDRISITYTSSQDGITWSAKKFWIHEIGIDILENFNAKTTLTLEAENA